MIVKIIIFVLIMLGIIELIDIIFDAINFIKEEKTEINVTQKADEYKKRKDWERRQ